MLKFLKTYFCFMFFLFGAIHAEESLAELCLDEKNHFGSYDTHNTHLHKMRRVGRQKMLSWAATRIPTRLNHTILQELLDMGSVRLEIKNRKLEERKNLLTGQFMPPTSEEYEKWTSVDQLVTVKLKTQTNDYDFTNIDLDFYILDIYKNKSGGSDIFVFEESRTYTNVFSTDIINVIAEKPGNIERMYRECQFKEQKQFENFESSGIPHTDSIVDAALLWRENQGKTSKIQFYLYSDSVTRHPSWNSNTQSWKDASFYEHIFDGRYISNSFIYNVIYSLQFCNNDAKKLYYTLRGGVISPYNFSYGPSIPDDAIPVMIKLAQELPEEYFIELLQRLHDLIKGLNSLTAFKEYRRFIPTLQEQCIPAFRADKQVEDKWKKQLLASINDFSKKIELPQQRIINSSFSVSDNVVRMIEQDAIKIFESWQLEKDIHKITNKIFKVKSGTHKKYNFYIEAYK